MKIDGEKGKIKLVFKTKAIWKFKVLYLSFNYHTWLMCIICIIHIYFLHVNYRIMYKSLQHSIKDGKKSFWMLNKFMMIVKIFFTVQLDRQRVEEASSLKTLP